MAQLLAQRRVFNTQGTPTVRCMRYQTAAPITLSSSRGVQSLQSRLHNRETWPNRSTFSRGKIRSTARTWRTRKPRRAGRAGRTKHLEGGRRLAGADFARWHAREEAARHHDLRSRSRPSAPGSADIHTRTFHMPGSSDRPGPESGPRAGVAYGARAPLCAYSRRRTWRRAHQG